MPFEQALEYVDAAMSAQLGRTLRDPERLVLRGTWQGWTYEQMAEASEYSINYLMRDIAPKLWKRLSKALGQSMSKTNFKVRLEQLLLEPWVANPEPAGAGIGGLGSAYERGPAAMAASVGWQSPQQPVLSKPEKYAWVPSTNATLSYGYDAELSQLQQWILSENCNIVSVFGPSGIGKTSLAQAFLDQCHQKFDFMVWRSLKQAPTLTQLLQTFLPDFLAVPYAPQDAIAQVCSVFQSQSLLLVLDDVDAMLKPGELPGSWRSGYEDYGDFFQAVAVGQHQSCLFLNSWENPVTIRNLAVGNPLTHQLGLSGLSAEAGQLLLKAEGLHHPECWPQLIDYYQGNPQYLQGITHLIHELMGGNTAEFCAQASFMIGPIKTALKEIFARLSTMEKEMLYWLTSKAEPVSLSMLTADTPPQLATQDLLMLLDALKQRSLLNILQRDGQSWFTLKPMIADYVTSRFIAQFRENDAAPRFGSGQQLSPQGGGIRLTAAKLAPVNLSPWFQNHFQPGWQALDRLFEGSATPAWRFRSTFNLRDGRVIKRFKRIPFDQAKARHVALVVAISREGDQSIRISVQAQPANITELLPVSLALNLLDADATVLASVETQEEDLFIQLPDFYGEPGEQFNIQLSNAYANHTEAFVL